MHTQAYVKDRKPVYYLSAGALHVVQLPDSHPMAASLRGEVEERIQRLPHGAPCKCPLCGAAPLTAAQSTAAILMVDTAKRSGDAQSQEFLVVMCNTCATALPGRGADAIRARLSLVFHKNFKRIQIAPGDLCDQCGRHRSEFMLALPDGSTHHPCVPCAPEILPRALAGRRGAS